jgi:hypothetical protein
MARRYEHVGKSSHDKEYYVRHLGKLDYAPTAEESFRFPESDNLEEDLSVPSTVGKRSRPLGQLITENFRANWIGWAVVLLVGLTLYFATTFSGKLGSMESTLNETRNTLENIEDRIQDQEIRLIEQTFRIDYLERILGK